MIKRGNKIKYTSLNKEGDLTKGKVYTAISDEHNSIYLYKKPSVYVHDDSGFLVPVAANRFKKLINSVSFILEVE